MLKKFIKGAETVARCQLSGGLETLRKFLIVFVRPYILFRVCHSLLACTCKETDQKLRQSKLGNSGIGGRTHAKLQMDLISR
jgi:hypothetical protein